MSGIGEHPSVNDELTEAVGHWGLFQTLVVLYDAVAFLAMGAHSTIYVLIAPNDAQHWCRRPSPSSPADVSDEEWRRANIPAQPDGSYAPCVRYEVLAPGLSADGGYEDGAHLPRRTVPCDSWQFNGTRGAGSILEEWSLVCERAWLVTFSSVFFMCGSCLGLIVSGFLSDRFGRRPLIFGAAVVLEAAGVAVYSAQSFFLFALLRFVVSCCVFSIAFVANVLVIEVSEVRMRGFCAMVGALGYAAGVILVFALGELRLTWRTAQLSLMVPTTLLLLCFAVVIESPRWLYAMMDKRGARIAIAEIRRTNAILHGHMCNEQCKLQHHGETLNLTTPVMAAVPSGSAVSQSKDRSDGRIPSSPGSSVPSLSAKRIFLMLISKKLCIINLGNTLIWFVGMMNLYGLMLGLDTSAQSNLLVAAGVAGSPLVSYAGLEWMGRVPSMAASQFVCGAICFAHSVQITGYVVRPLFAEMTAWFFANTALNIALLYGVEAYPTPVRCLGYCISTGVGMLGTVAGPVITASVKQYGNEVPYMVMAIGCLASGIVTLFLPETRARKLPEVAEQHGNIFEFLPFHKMNQSEIEHQRKQRRSLSVHSHRLRDGAQPFTGGLDKPAATDATERLGPIRADTLAGTAALRVQTSGTTAESGQVDPGEIMSARQRESAELAKDEIPPALTQSPPSGISPRSPASPEILCSPSVGSSGSPPGSPDAASDPRPTIVVGTTTNAPSYMRDSETIVLGERRTSTVAGATRSKKAARKHSTHGGHGSRSAAAKPRKTV